MSFEGTLGRGDIPVPGKAGTARRGDMGFAGVAASGSAPVPGKAVPPRRGDIPVPGKAVAAGEGTFLSPAKQCCPGEGTFLSAAAPANSQPSRINNRKPPPEFHYRHYQAAIPQSSPFPQPSRSRMQARFDHITLSALSVCTGPQTRTLDDDAHLYADSPGQLQRMRSMVGIERRHVAPRGVTTLDLCEAAARDLFSAAEVDTSSVDAVLCVTQTPDHWQPCNANLLHGRLGLSKGAAAFDVNQGCSGWVYGFYLAAAMLEAGGARRVLLLAGDTVTHCIHPRDRATVPLFGDAGSAALVERSNDAAPAWFALHSDGTGHGAIKVPAGAFRQPAGPETSVESIAEDGSVRTPENLFMSGIEVFNFTLREEPGAVRELLAFADTEAESVDAFVFHQANPFILKNLAKRLRLPEEKVPMDTARRFGNQSSASVPAALAHDLGEVLSRERRRVLCSGFGVGLSWASCLLDIGPAKHIHIFQYQTS